MEGDRVNPKNKTEPQRVKRWKGERKLYLKTTRRNE